MHRVFISNKPFWPPPSCWISQKYQKKKKLCFRLCCKQTTNHFILLLSCVCEFSVRLCIHVDPVMLLAEMSHIKRHCGVHDRSHCMEHLWRKNKGIWVALWNRSFDFTIMLCPIFFPLGPLLISTENLSVIGAAARCHGSGQKTHFEQPTPLLRIWRKGAVVECREGATANNLSKLEK